MAFGAGCAYMVVVVASRQAESSQRPSTPRTQVRTWVTVEWRCSHQLLQRIWGVAVRERAGGSPEQPCGSGPEAEAASIADPTAGQLRRPAAGRQGAADFEGGLPAGAVGVFPCFGSPVGGAQNMGTPGVDRVPVFGGRGVGGLFDGVPHGGDAVVPYGDPQGDGVLVANLERKLS